MDEKVMTSHMNINIKRDLMSRDVDEIHRVGWLLLSSPSLLVSLSYKVFGHLQNVGPGGLARYGTDVLGLGVECLIHQQKGFLTR
jgi:hypothetical protein